MSQFCEVHDEKEPCNRCWQDEDDAALLAAAAAAEEAREDPSGSGPCSPVARKRPRAVGVAVEDEPLPLPDLDDYFDQFGLGHVERVQLCRTYANHLSARMRMVKRRL